MVNTLESNVTKLYEDLEDFLKACLIRKTFRDPPDFLRSNRELFKEERDKEKFDRVFTKGAAGTLENFAHWWEDQRNVNTWVGITGSWRYIDQKVVDDVTNTIRYLTNKDIGILTGGALGVDYLATETIIKEGNPENLRIALPINRADYIRHFRNSASSNVINPSQRNAIANQIFKISKRHPEIIFDNSEFNSEEFLDPRNNEYREDCYLFRNHLVGYGCDGLD